ncbi:MAG: nicotinate (nicotinamide) nucleotide adenylyltransferase [Planctomycetes bacterium HGW-Planctomycetes-1]|nr:MAG: nicotinate (nicotinamide) nucleotide adenylyltransferase [Planctomycetes bacterium HGW-Planctomycetes-1]
MAEKIVLFGGTFDPIHIGHIEVASAAAEKIGAGEIILIPARRSPHKNLKPLAPDNDRIAMMKLAVEDKSLFEINPVELNRAEPSYTIDTIRQLKQSLGGDCILYWLIGADMLESLPKWHKIDELLNECNICVMNRGGFEKPDFDKLAPQLGSKNIEKLRKNVVETPSIEISSTQIRRKILNNEDVSKYLHPEVLNYIKIRRLYAATD